MRLKAGDVEGFHRRKCAAIFDHALQSGGGPTHSRTLARVVERKNFRQVLDCASPLALSKWLKTVTQNGSCYVNRSLAVLLVKNKSKVSELVPLC
jgi:hypothetical protein